MGNTTLIHETQPLTSPSYLNPRKNHLRFSLIHLKMYIMRSFQYKLKDQCTNQRKKNAQNVIWM